MEINKNRRYWAIRSDKNNIQILLSELRAGRLRQGWGYSQNQDLRLVQAEILRGGKWWERLSETQKEVLPHLKMLSSVEGGIQIGDLIVIPNLPEYGPFFMIVEIIGEYYYEMLNLSRDQEVNEFKYDYGHILPVKIVTDQGVNRYAEIVDARIRSTLKTPMRMWNIDGYGQIIEQLISNYKAGGDFYTVKSGNDRLQNAWEIAIVHASKQLEERLGLELDARFQAAEWEEPIMVVLKELYPKANVRWVAGSNEHGADVVINITNHFGGSNWLIVVQIKNYSGEIGYEVLEQIKAAHEHYSSDGQILSLVVMTTAESMSTDLAEKSLRLEEDLNIPVKIVLRKELLRIMSEGLMFKKKDEQNTLK